MNACAMLVTPSPRRKRPLPVWQALKATKSALRSKRVTSSSCKKPSLSWLELPLGSRPKTSDA